MPASHWSKSLELIIKKVFARASALLIMTLASGLGAQACRAGEADVSAFFDTAPSPTNISICLSSHEAENTRLGSEDASNLSKLTIHLQKPASTDSGWALEAGVKAGFKDSNRIYPVEMTCDPAVDSPGSFGCWVLCGEGISLDLRENARGNINAEISVGKSNFDNTKGTRSKIEKLELIPVDMQVCEPDPA